jgi:predicted nucleotidyltransferase
MNYFKYIKDLKKELQKEGFIIDGIVGSMARGEKFNDIDIVYHVTDTFVEKYGGFGAVIKIEEIKKNLNSILKKEVDLIALSNLSATAKKYMLKDFKNV